ncbi:mechanosensitive ion channel family protein [Chloroflexota bacterium]
MKRKTAILSSLIVLSAILGYFSFKYTNIYLQNALYTAITLAITYLVFKVILEEVVSKRIKESKTRYSLRKISTILYLLTLVAIVIAIWVENPQALLVSYGVLAAGAAFALQDVLRDFAGGIAIVLTGIYRIGDRIEINSKSGDVMDIGILYTTLMEIKEWIPGDLPTGRLTTIPNSYVLSSTVNNYTKDHPYIWDEISIPITYDSDWKEAISKILNIVKRETKIATKEAEKSVSRLGERYYISKWAMEPALFLKLTDNWIEFNIRYITNARQRRKVQASLSQTILEEVQKSEGIRIASVSFNIGIREQPAAKPKKRKS